MNEYTYQVKYINRFTKRLKDIYNTENEKEIESNYKKQFNIIQRALYFYTVQRRVKSKYENFKSDYWAKYLLNTLQSK